MGGQNVYSCGLNAKRNPRIRGDAREIKVGALMLEDRMIYMHNVQTAFLVLSVVFEHQTMFCLLHYNRLRGRNSATQNGA